MGQERVSPWQTLGSRVVYRNRWIAVREDRVIRPDGAAGIYGVVEIPRSCGIVALREDGQVALVGQWRYVHGRYSVEIPTGGTEPGESPLDGARRELAEETGLTGGRWTGLGTVDNSNGVTTDVAHLFLARGLTSGPPAELGDERVELTWAPFAEAVRLVLAGEITESVSVAGLLKTQLLGLGPV
jgi:8-oxo-dGTP pyrophosphatase MutT (NUDIX family)